MPTAAGEILLEHARANHLVRRSGCLYVYGSQQSSNRWKWGMDLRRSLGVELRDVGEDELAGLEPDLKGRFRFGLLAPDNGSTVDPEALVKAIHGQCLADGAHSIAAAATGFERGGDRVRAVHLTTGEKLECDGVVVATGAWSRALCRTLGASRKQVTRSPTGSGRGRPRRLEAYEKRMRNKGVVKAFEAFRQTAGASNWIRAGIPFVGRDLADGGNRFEGDFR